MNEKKTFWIVMALIVIVGIVGAYDFKIEPLITEGEIDAFDTADAQYISDNFQSLVVLEKIDNVQPPKECFDKSLCTNEKKDVVEWCASVFYGIPDTSFNQFQPFCFEIATGSTDSEIQQALEDNAIKTFESLKLVTPPIYLINQSQAVVNQYYDFTTGQWIDK